MIIRSQSDELYHNNSASHLFDVGTGYSCVN